ncbi:MAG: GGDEF domain-containing protein [Solimonas sp.]
MIDVGDDGDVAKVLDAHGRVRMLQCGKKWWGILRECLIRCMLAFVGRDLPLKPPGQRARRRLAILWPFPSPEAAMSRPLQNSGTRLRQYRQLSRWLSFHHLDEKLSCLFVLALTLPLLALAGCALLWPQASPGLALIPALLAALIAGGLALWGLQQLLAPLRMAQSALRVHADSGRVQPLPTDLRDDMGRMLGELRLVLETAESRGQAVQALSFDDPLTGLPNPRFAAEYLRLAVYAAERGDLRLSVALIDPEHIGRLNEARGVEAGDQAIRQVGEFLHQWLRRKCDWVGRWRDDQFLVVMFCEQPTAAEYLGKLQRQLGRQMQDFEGLGLAVNLGVAELRRHEGLAEFRERLEDELRQAKGAQLSSPPPPASAKLYSIAAALRKTSRSPASI